MRTMKKKKLQLVWLVICIAAIVLVQLLMPAYTAAQGTAPDYERARKLKARYESAAIDIAGAATWIGNTDRFWYRKLSKGMNDYFIFDAQTLQKQPAFDQTKIAAALSKLTGNTYKPGDLPLTGLRFDNSGAAFFAAVDGTQVRCVVADSACAKVEPPARGARGPIRSPDGKWEALINNYNVVVRAPGSHDLTFLSTDGSEGNYYEPRSVVWSPDSSRLAAYRVRPGYKREVHYVESSPEDQIQPKYTSIIYAKPGDTLDLEQPVLFEIVAKRQINIDNALFANSYELSDLVWRKDSR